MSKYTILILIFYIDYRKKFPYYNNYKHVIPRKYKIPQKQNIIDNYFFHIQVLFYMSFKIFDSFFIIAGSTS